MRRRAGRTLIPWLAWVPVFLVFDLLTGSFHASPAAFSYSFRTGFGHLWYLLLIQQMYVVYAFWPQRWSWRLAILAMAVQTALSVVRVTAMLPNGWQEQLMLTYGFLLFPFWTGYFAVGVAAGRTIFAPATPSGGGGGARRLASTLRESIATEAYPGIRGLIIIFTAAVAASGYLLLNFKFHGAHWVGFLQGTGAFLNPVLPLFVFSITVWVFAAAPPLMRRSQALARSLRFLGDLSLGIYIVHPIFLWVFGRLIITKLTIGGPVSIASFFALVLAVLVVTVIAVRLLVATPLAVTLGSARRPLGWLRFPRIRRRGAVGHGDFFQSSSAKAISPRR
jgi:surface polysaccharide O-acyltransferase-like enzyme